MKHGGEPPSSNGQTWLDLSTGISPRPYPIPTLAPHLWQDLPRQSQLDGLLNAARTCYQVPDSLDVFAAPGTESLIFAMPRLHDGEARILGPTYSSHAESWGGRAQEIAEPQLADHAGKVTILVNPNNPTGRLISPERLRQIIDSGGKNSLLIVDEAFMDLTPDQSIIPHLKPTDSVIVLRSFGKFFGLAGLRLGFAIGQPDLIAQLRPLFGSWAVNGPALTIGTHALLDQAWQQDQRAYLSERSQRLFWILKSNGIAIRGQTNLFALGEDARALARHEQLAKAGIWTRIFDGYPNWIRIGLPRTEPDMVRLNMALRNGA